MCVCACVCVCGFMVNYLPVVNPVTQSPCETAAKVDQLLPLIVWRSPDSGGSQLALALQTKVEL